MAIRPSLVLVFLLWISTLTHASTDLVCGSSVNIDQAGAYTLRNCNSFSVSIIFTIANDVSLSVSSSSIGSLVIPSSYSWSNVSLDVSDSTLIVSRPLFVMSTYSPTVHQGVRLSLLRTTVTLSSSTSSSSSSSSSYLVQCTSSSAGSASAMTLQAFSLQIISSTVSLSSTATIADMGLVSSGCAMVNGQVMVKDTSVAVSWSYGQSTTLTGMASTASLVSLVGGGSDILLTFQNVPVSIPSGVSTLVTVIRLAQQPFRRVTISLTTVRVTATLSGPRIAATASSMSGLQREVALVFFTTAAADCNVSVVSSSLTSSLSSQASASSAGLAMFDMGVASVVHFYGANSTVTIYRSTLTTMMPNGNGPSGLINAIIGTMLAVAPDLSITTSSSSSLSLANVRLQVAWSVMNVSLANRVMCASSRSFLISSYSLSTQSVGAALLFAHVLIGTDFFNVSLTVHASRLAIQLPDFSLCPSQFAYISVFGFSVSLAIPSANLTIACSSIVGSVQNLAMSVLKTMMSDPMVSGQLSGLTPGPPLSAAALSWVTTNTTLQILSGIRQFLPTSNSLYAATAILIGCVVSEGVSAAVQIAVPYGSFGIPALLLRDVQFDTTSTGGSFDVSGFKPSDSSIGGSSSTLLLPPAVLQLASVQAVQAGGEASISPSPPFVLQMSLFNIQFGKRVSPVSALVLVSNVTLPITWDVRRVSWGSSSSTPGSSAVPFFNDVVDPASQLPLRWPPVSYLSVACSRINDQLATNINLMFNEASVALPPPGAYLMLGCTRTETLRRTPARSRTRTYEVTETRMLTPSRDITRTNTASKTHQIPFTPTVDLNGTAPAVLSYTPSALATLVAILTMAVPGGFPASMAMQRTYGALRLGDRCNRVIPILDAEWELFNAFRVVYNPGESDASPVLSSTFENPLQIAIRSSWISPTLHFVGGGLIGNLVISIAWGIVCALILFVHSMATDDRYAKTIYARQRRWLFVFAAIVLCPYTALLQPTVAGAVGALQYVASYGNGGIQSKFRDFDEQDHIFHSKWRVVYNSFVGGDVFVGLITLFVFLLPALWVSFVILKWFLWQPLSSFPLRMDMLFSESTTTGSAVRSMKTGSEGVLNGDDSKGAKLLEEEDDDDDPEVVFQEEEEDDNTSPPRDAKATDSFDETEFKVTPSETKKKTTLFSQKRRLTEKGKNNISSTSKRGGGGRKEGSPSSPRAVVPPLLFWRGVERLDVDWDGVDREDNDDDDVEKDASPEVREAQWAYAFAPKLLVGFLDGLHCDYVWYLVVELVCSIVMGILTGVGWWAGSQSQCKTYSLALIGPVALSLSLVAIFRPFTATVLNAQAILLNATTLVAIILAAIGSGSAASALGGVITVLCFATILTAVFRAVVMPPRSLKQRRMSTSRGKGLLYRQGLLDWPPGGADTRVDDEINGGVGVISCITPSGGSISYELLPASPPPPLHLIVDDSLWHALKLTAIGNATKWMRGAAAGGTTRRHDLSIAADGSVLESLGEEEEEDGTEALHSKALTREEAVSALIRFVSSIRKNS